MFGNFCGKRRARLTEAERTAERERIARELHDTLLQEVQALLIRLDTWANDLVIPKDRREKIAGTAQMARELVVKGRERILMLRQPDVERMSLAETLRSIGTTESGQRAVRINVFSHGKSRALTLQALDYVVAIAREAIRNAIRHARPSAIEVEVSFRSLHLDVAITDDGCGISETLAAGEAKPGHFGLIGMRERAQLLQAPLRIKRLVPAGTRVSFRVPGGVAFRE